jgi:gamma-glutamylcyclotransferase (GGCT)/AIG2-like uncharacterized protein YtfP
VGEGRVPGRLCDLGNYPGAILDARSETNVTGEVFALPDGQSILPNLDSYEDFDPADRRTSLFVRERHPVMLSDWRRLECWVYVYNRNPGEAPLVVGGNYSKYKAATTPGASQSGKAKRGQARFVRVYCASCPDALAFTWPVCRYTVSSVATTARPVSSVKMTPWPILTGWAKASKKAVAPCTPTCS